MAIALSKPKLLAQLEFYLRLQREASYSNKITAPDETPEQLLEHALKLNKFDVISDEFGEIIAINDKEKTLFNYYRNNILHIFAVPSLVALHLFKQHQSTVTHCHQLVKSFYHRDRAEVIARAGLVPGGRGSDHPHRPRDLRGRALVEGGEAQPDRLTGHDLIDVGDRQARLYHQLTIRHDCHHPLAGRDHAIDRVHAQLVDAQVASKRRFSPWGLRIG